MTFKLPIQLAGRELYMVNMWLHGLQCNFGIITPVMHSGRQIALGFASCNLSPSWMHYSCNLSQIKPYYIYKSFECDYQVKRM